MMQIAENAGTEGAVVLERVKDHEFGYGWNAATSTYENLLESGVIDPATVTQQAVLNSASIAASIITTSVRGTPWCILLKRAREGGSLIAPQQLFPLAAFCAAPFPRRH